MDKVRVLPLALLWALLSTPAFTQVATPGSGTPVVTAVQLGREPAVSGDTLRLINAVLLCGVLAGAAILVIAYRLRRARVRQFALAATQGARSQRDAVFELGRALFREVKRHNRDPVFLTRLLTPLGPSPIAVLKRGGCCSGIHRLFIASLDAIDIRAAQITVYASPGPVARHCLVQVNLSPAPLIIDVDYGVWYRHPDGRSVGIRDLRSGVIPVIEPFVLDPQALRREPGRVSIPPGYPSGSYYVFDFPSTRTANWTKSRTRRATYGLLQHVTQGRVDSFLLPPICEWPEVLVAAALFGLGVILLVAELARTLG
jgi:hypothetical protein